MSIVNELTPAQLVAATKKASFGIEGYDVPNLSPKKSQRAAFSKSTALGPIAKEAAYRKAFPSPQSYSIPSSKTWDEQAKSIKPSFSKSPRTLESQRIALNSKNPEKSTPSPFEYKKETYLPSISKKSIGAGMP